MGLAPTAAALLAILLSWELAVQITRVPAYLMPSPSRVAARLADNPEFFLQEGLTTLFEALAGLAVGGGLAVLAAIPMAQWRWLERSLLPLAILVKVTPIITLAPLFVLWFGFGPLPKVLIAALLTFFPVLVAAVGGFRAVDPAALEVLLSLNASPAELFAKLRAPFCLPYLMGALKVSATLSLIGAVVAEWVGADRGLGRVIILANSNLDTPTVFAGVFVLAIMGVCLVGALSLLEQRLLFWHESQLSSELEREGRS